MHRANEHGDQEQHLQVFGLRPEEGEEQEGDAGKTGRGEEDRRHAQIRNHPACDDNVEAPDKAHGEQKDEIAKGHVFAVSRIYPGWAGGFGLSLAAQPIAGKIALFSLGSGAGCQGTECCGTR